MPDLDLEALERDREGGYGKIQTERLIQALPALIARIRELEADNDRLRRERAAALTVTTTDGMTASEWVLRTGLAERARDELRAALSSLLSTGDGDLRAEVRVIVRDRLTEAGVDWRTLAGPREVKP